VRLSAGFFRLNDPDIPVQLAGGDQDDAAGGIFGGPQDRQDAEIQTPRQRVDEIDALQAGHDDQFGDDLRQFVAITLDSPFPVERVHPLSTPRDPYRGRDYRGRCEGRWTSFFERFIR
jgi:hypothetical protein